MHRVKTYKLDWISILIYLALVFLGCLSIYSSSYNPNSEISFLSLNTIIGRQIFFIIFALIISIFILLIDFKIIFRLSYLIYFISIISLILVLFIGKEVGGAKAWFDFGKFGLQPSEFAKFATILGIAKFIHDQDIYLNKLKTLIIICWMLLVPCLLIMKQPDAGSALVYGSLIIMFFREGLQLRYILSIIIIGFLSFLTMVIGVNSTIIFLIFIALIFAYLLKRNKKTLIPALIFFT